MYERLEIDVRRFPTSVTVGEKGRLYMLYHCIDSWMKGHWVILVGVGYWKVKYHVCECFFRYKKKFRRVGLWGITRIKAYLEAQRAHVFRDHQPKMSSHWRKLNLRPCTLQLSQRSSTNVCFIYCLFGFFIFSNQCSNLTTVISNVCFCNLASFQLQITWESYSNSSSHFTLKSFQDVHNV